MKSLTETKYFEVIGDKMCFSPKDRLTKYSMVIRFKEENLPCCENVEAPYPPVIALGEILNYLDKKFSFNRTDPTEIKVNVHEVALGCSSGRKQWQQLTECWLAYRIEKGMGHYMERCWRTGDIFRIHLELELVHEQAEE